MARAIIWSIILGMTIFGGAAIQYVTFKTQTNSFGDAMKAWPILWVVYFLVAHSVGERLFRGVVKKWK